MRTEDLKKKIGDWKKMMGDVLERQTRTDRVIEALRAKEEKARIASILPREAFSDERGFKQKEFEEIVNYVHKKGLDDQYITILGVGLITLRNEQNKINLAKQDLKQNKVPTNFGDSIKFPQAPISNNNNNNQNPQQNVTTG
jgi:hypothetical protein